MVLLSTAMTSSSETDTDTSRSTTGTFLVWVPGAKNNANATRESRQQVFQRHRHAALVHHQRRKERRSQEPSRILSKPLCRFLPLPSAASYPGRVTPSTASRLLSPSPPIDLDLGRFDPFDTLCVRGLSGNALALVQFGMFCLWSIPPPPLPSQPSVLLHQLTLFFQPSTTNGRHLHPAACPRRSSPGRRTP